MLVFERLAFRNLVDKQSLKVALMNGFERFV